MEKQQGQWVPFLPGIQSLPADLEVPVDQMNLFLLQSLLVPEGLENRWDRPLTLRLADQWDPRCLLDL